MIRKKGTISENLRQNMTRNRFLLFYKRVSLIVGHILGCRAKLGVGLNYFVDRFEEVFLGG